MKNGQSTWTVFKQCFEVRKSTNKLLRPQKQGFPALDGIRALGMITVVMGHVLAIIMLFQVKYFNKTKIEAFDETPWYISFVSNAHFMVDLFFVLSGFLIAGILFKEHQRASSINIKRFYYRRFMRLMPTYAFVCAIFYLINAPNKEALWQNLLYINNFFDHRETAASWTWSLAVEEQFYLVFPILVSLLFASQKRFIISLFALFILSFVVRAYIYFGHPILGDNPIYNQLIDTKLEGVYLSELYDNLYTRYGAFLCGIYAAYLYNFKQEQVIDFYHKKRLGMVAILLSYAVFTLIMLVTWYKTFDFPQWFLDFYYISMRNVFCIAATVLLLGTIVGGQYLNRVKNYLSKPFLYPLAQLTYSAYLIHPPVAAVVIIILRALMPSVFMAELVPPLWMLALAFIFATLITYFFSALIFIFLENPLMIWRDLRSGKSYRGTVSNMLEE